MTDFPDEAHDQRVANDPDPVAGQPNPTPTDQPGSASDTSGPVPPGPVPPGFVAGPPTSSFPGSGYGPGYGPQFVYPPPAAPPSRAGGSKAALIAIVVIGLVAVLGIGVAVGLSVSGGSSTTAGPASIPASPSQVPSATSAPPSATSAPPSGKYSMKAIASACDLIDPKPLLKWSSTPVAPTHQELPPDGGYGGSLTCNLNYTSTSPTDGVTTHEAGIGVEIEFTSAGQPPGYDTWNNVTTAPKGWSTGTIPGLGSRNSWRGRADTDPAPGASYIVDVQDSNVSVEVQVAVHRAPGEDPLNLDDLAAIAQSQTRTVLDRLKQP